jgi:hypothetical protein
MKTQITKSISLFQNSVVFQSLKVKASAHRLFIYALELVILFVLVFATVSTFAQTATVPSPAQAVSEAGRLALVKQSVVFNAGKVYLNWVVKSNSEDCIYVVERSSDGIEYEPVGLKEGIGSPLELLYSWVDTKPESGDTFYRIKQINEEGKLVAQADPKAVAVPESTPIFLEKGSKMVSAK